MSPKIKRWVKLVALAAVSGASFLVAYALRFGGTVPEEHVAPMWVIALCAVGVKLFSFCWHRLDQSVNRYIGFHDLLPIAKADQS